MRSNYLPDFTAGGKAYFSFAVSIALVILLFSPPVFAAGPGDLDLTFGSGGLVPLQIGMSQRTSDTVLIQPDGKIIIAGTIPVQCFECYDFAVMRLLPNGQLDASFGTNGVVTTDLRNSQAGFGRDRVNDAALQSDGKIVVGGWSEFWYGAPFPGSNYALVRYNADGTLDTTFDGDGKLVMPEMGWHSQIMAVAVKPDGEIVCAGNFGRCPDCVYRERIDAIRINPAGAFVGVTQITQTGDVHAKEMLIQPDGKILIGGYAINSPRVGYVFARLLPNGSPDETFGSGETGTGTAFIPGNVSIYESVVDFALHGDGKIFAAGVTGVNYPTRDFEVLRLNAHGSLDTTFGSGGRVITAVSDNYDNVGGLIVQPDGKVLVGGFGSSLGVVIVRYNPDGSLDRSFGRGGIASSHFAVVLADLALQADGKIVTTGGKITIARFLNSGQHRDYDFDGDGRDDVSIFRPNSAAAEWYWLNSSTGQSSGFQFGIGADKPVPADYDGDGKTDISVFRDGDWYRLNSSNNQFVVVHFGQAGDLPVPSDYDGDSKTDLAVYRAGNWYVLNSGNNSFRAEQFGISTDKPIIGDFDGDGKADLTVYRDGIWYGQRSRDGFFGVQFGINTDKPVGADYDGDGKTDLAVYRDGNWYLLRSQQGFIAAQFGTANDRPIPNAFVP